MEAKDAATATAQAATTLLQASEPKDPKTVGSLAQGLSGVLSAVAPEEIPIRSATAASVVALPGGTGHLLTALALPAAEPLPCRLSTPQLVELLKMPGYVGAARRVVLDHLDNRYRHRFADVWEFVRFAQEQHLGLDFTTPPQRPGVTAASPR
jgi:hypothetical protein